MAATGTPTPNIGLRIPIGTDPASVDDINYNSNLLDTKLGAVGSDSVQDQIDTLNGKILEKTSFVDLGNKTGMKNAWDALTIYDKAVIGQYNNGGVRAFFAYKYTGSQYGFMLQIRWGSNNIDTMTVSDGVETIKTINAS